MKNIYTYSGQPALRDLTVACLLKNKSAGVRMTQVTAFDAEEAAAAASQKIDTLTIDSTTTSDIRAAAPNIFITAAQTMRQYVTEDEAHSGAIDAMVNGADAIYTPRGLGNIERICPCPKTNWTSSKKDSINYSRYTSKQWL
ncbi:MAG: hypothetical protein AB8B84_09265 [Granulosicoccus sp.]